MVLFLDRTRTSCYWKWKPSRLMPRSVSTNSIPPLRKNLKMGPMNATASRLQHTVTVLCNHVAQLPRTEKDWRLMSAEDLFYALAVCIISSQSKYELAIAVANKLRKVGLLKRRTYERFRRGFEDRVLSTLSEPVQV